MSHTDQTSRGWSIFHRSYGKVRVYSTSTQRQLRYIPDIWIRSFSLMFVFCLFFPLMRGEIESCVFKLEKKKQIIGLGGRDTWSELCSEISLCCFKMYTASGAVGNEPSLTFPLRAHFTFTTLQLTNWRLPKHVNSEIHQRSYKICETHFSSSQFSATCQVNVMHTWGFSKRIMWAQAERDCGLF